MELGEVFGVVEHAPAAAEIRSGHFLDALIRDQEDIELRPDLVNQPAKLGTVILRIHAVEVLVADPRQVTVQDAQVTVGAQVESEAHDHRLDVVIHQYGDDGVFHRRHDDRFVGERILDPPHLLQIRAQRFLLGSRQRIDDQHLEVRLRVSPLLRRLFDVLELLAFLRLAADRNRPSPVGAARQRAHDACRDAVHFGVIAVGELVAQVLETPIRREGPVSFDGLQGLQQFVGLLLQLTDVLAFRMAPPQTFCDVLERAPAVAAQLRCAVVGVEVEFSRFCRHVVSCPIRMTRRDGVARGAVDALALRCLRLRCRRQRRRIRREIARPATRQLQRPELPRIVRPCISR